MLYRVLERTAEVETLVAVTARIHRSILAAVLVIVLVVIVLLPQLTGGLNGTGITAGNATGIQVCRQRVSWML